MSEINLNFEIYCKRPPWAIENPIDLSMRFNNPKIEFPFTSRYRIYINNDLITERTWIWNNHTFLKENIWINSPNSEYELKIEPVIYVAEQAKFRLDNFTVTNMQADSTKVNDLQVNFTIR